MWTEIVGLANLTVKFREPQMMAERNWSIMKFITKNITDFLNRYEDLCYDFSLLEIKKINKLFRYCEKVLECS